MHRQGVTDRAMNRFAISKNSFMRSIFYKLLFSSTVNMVSNAINAMLDSIIAGRVLGADYTAAVAICSSFFNIVSFFSSLVICGFGIVFSNSIGATDRQQASKEFSTTLYAQLFLAIAVTIALYFNLEGFITLLGAIGNLKSRAYDYLAAIVPFCFAFFLSDFLYTTAFFEGNSALCTIGSLCAIVINIVFSIILSSRMGIAGIGYATIIGQLASCAIYLIHFIKKKSQVKLLRYFDIHMVVKMIRLGIPNISVFVLSAISIMLVNNYIGSKYGEYYLYLFSIANTYVNAVYFLFCGVAEALLPIVGIYNGENNPAAIRTTMNLSLKVSAVVSTLIIVATWLLSTQIAMLFGVKAAEDILNIAYAIRMFSTGLLMASIGHVVCIYYTAMQYTGISFFHTLLKSLLVFVSCIEFLGGISPRFIWFGLAASESISLCIVLLLVFIYSKGKKHYSDVYLLDRDREQHTKIIECKSDMQQIMHAQNEAEVFLRSYAMDNRLILKCAMLIEETGVILSAHDCLVEFTIFAEDNMITLIVHDSAQQLDLFDNDNQVKSMQQYAALMLVNHESERVFFRTIGYNKTKFSIL